MYRISRNRNTPIEKWYNRSLCRVLESASYGQPIHNLPKSSPVFIFLCVDFSWSNQFDALRSAQPRHFWPIQFVCRNEAFLQLELTVFVCDRTKCRPLAISNIHFVVFQTQLATIYSLNISTMTNITRFLLLTINVHATTRPTTSLLRDHLSLIKSSDGRKEEENCLIVVNDRAPEIRALRIITSFNGCSLSTKHDVFNAIVTTARFNCVNISALMAIYILHFRCIDETECEQTIRLQN